MNRLLGISIARHDLHSCSPGHLATLAAVRGSLFGQNLPPILSRLDRFACGFRRRRRRPQRITGRGHGPHQQHGSQRGVFLPHLPGISVLLPRVGIDRATILNARRIPRAAQSEPVSRLTANSPLPRRLPTCANPSTTPHTASALPSSSRTAPDRATALHH